MPNSPASVAANLDALVDHERADHQPDGEIDMAVVGQSNGESGERTSTLTGKSARVSRHAARRCTLLAVDNQEQCEDAAIHGHGPPDGADCGRDQIGEERNSRRRACGLPKEPFYSSIGSCYGTTGP